VVAGAPESSPANAGAVKPKVIITLIAPVTIIERRMDRPTNKLMSRGSSSCFFGYGYCG
jgi:hypothetical protein